MEEITPAELSERIPAFDRNRLHAHQHIARAGLRVGHVLVAAVAESALAFGNSLEVFALAGLQLLQGEIES